MLCRPDRFAAGRQQDQGAEHDSAGKLIKPLCSAVYNEGRLEAHADNGYSADSKASIFFQSASIAACALRCMSR